METTTKNDTTADDGCVGSGDRFGNLRVRWQNLLCWKTRWAYRTLTNAMKRDCDYARTWKDNIACPLMDEGMSHEAANRAADRLMQHLFKIKPNAKDEPRAHERRKEA